MNIRSLAFSFFAVLFMVFIIGSCDSQLVETEQVDGELGFNEVPIVKTKPGSPLPSSVQEAAVEQPRYYCLVGTLNPNGTEWAYNHRKFAINIPNGLLKQVQKIGKDDQWVTFSLGHRDAAGREEADDFKGGGLARMAKCMLPPSEKIFKKVLKQLNKFKKGSWIYEHSGTSAGSASEDGIGPGPIQTEWVYVCTAYWVYKACFRDPETNILYDCEYTILGCSQTEMVPGEEGDPNDDGAPIVIPAPIPVTQVSPMNKALYQLAVWRKPNRVIQMGNIPV